MISAKAFAKIFHTLKNIATHDKKVLFFLIAFFLYIRRRGHHHR